MTTIELPFPPTLNNYRVAKVIKGRARLIASKKGREYKKTVLDECLVQRVMVNLSGPLSCTLDLYPPTNARRDVDNFSKAVLDGMTAANVYGDDSQILDLRIRMHPKKPPGKVVVTLEPMTDFQCGHNQMDLVGANP